MLDDALMCLNSSSNLRPKEINRFVTKINEVLKTHLFPSKFIHWQTTANRKIQPDGIETTDRRRSARRTQRVTLKQRSTKLVVRKSARTTTCEKYGTWSMIIELDRLTRKLDKGQRREFFVFILFFFFFLLYCSTICKREEFNLVGDATIWVWEEKERETGRARKRERQTDRQKEERTSSNCCSGLQAHTGEKRVCVCVSSTAFICWFVPVIELDSRHFLLRRRFLIWDTQSERSQVINYWRCTWTLNKRKHFQLALLPLRSLLIVFLNSVFRPLNYINIDVRKKKRLRRKDWVNRDLADLLLLLLLDQQCLRVTARAGVRERKKEGMSLSTTIERVIDDRW